MKREEKMGETEDQSLKGHTMKKFKNKEKKDNFNQTKKKEKKQNNTKRDPSNV